MADQPLNDAFGVGMIGLGTVGGGVAQLLTEHVELYAKRCGRPIELRRVLVRDVAKAQATGLVDASLLTDDADAFFQTQGLDAVVEVAGGTGVVAELVSRSLSDGKHVITANKSLLAAKGVELFALARQHDASIAFEASCAGGIPCITALQHGLMSNRVTGLAGILNGTCNYILTQMTRHGQTYADALAEAQDKGYAEADPTLDVSGQDAAQKLAILASLAFGVRVAEQDVPAVGVDTLDLSDIQFGDELGYDIKLLAIARQSEQGELSLGVEPCFVSKQQLIAQVIGPFNALSVLGDAIGHAMFYGPGAGREATASAVVSDLLNVASGWYPAAFAAMGLTPDLHEPAIIADPQDTVDRFYLRINALDKPGVLAAVTRVLGELGISLSAIVQHEYDAGQFVPVVITTHQARRGDVDQAIAQLASLDAIDGQPVVIRIVDMPG